MKYTLSTLPIALLIQITTFLSRPTSLPLISHTFHELEDQKSYWSLLLCAHFPKFVKPKQLNENEIKARDFKKIYYLLSCFIQEELSRFKNKPKLGWIQRNLDGFLDDVKQVIENFPWACYIQGSLLRCEGSEHKKEALELFKSAAENLPAAKKMMAYTLGLDKPESQLLLESAFNAEKDPQTAEFLGFFFKFQAGEAEDSNLINEHRQSAIKWYEIALDLHEGNKFYQKVIIDILTDLFVRGSRESFKFLQKYRRYHDIFCQYEGFTESGVITMTRKGFHTSWLKEMRETKDIAVKKLCADNLLELYNLFRIFKSKPWFYWLNDLQMEALTKECFDVLGRQVEGERFVEQLKIRFPQPLSKSPLPSRRDKCLTM